METLQESLLKISRFVQVSLMTPSFTLEEEEIVEVILQVGLEVPILHLVLNLTVEMTHVDVQKIGLIRLLVGY